jgi:elongation factor G
VFRLGWVVVLRAVRGLASSETVWRQANKYHVPRVSFVNKMDRIGAVPKGYRKVFERGWVLIRLYVLPVGVEDSFRGHIDL